MVPLYEFEDVDTGEPVEVYLRMDDAPEIGAEVVIAGRGLRRVPSREKIQAHVDNTNFKCFSQAPWTPGAKHYDDKGHPCFTSKRDAQEFGKRNDLTYGEL